MKRITFLLLMFTAISSLNAQDYAFDKIPSELKRGADVVLRYSEMSLTIDELDQAVFSEKTAYTILNEDAFGWAVFNESYDKLSKLKGIKILYYDAKGEVIKKVKSGEIEDINITSSGSLYDDNRIKYYEPEEYDYPFTIEYEYENPFSSTVGFRNFVTQYGEGISVQKAVYRAEFPANYELRHKELNGMAAPVEQNLGKTKVLTWTMENEKAIKEEVAGESAYAMAKKVLIAPSKFSMEGYEGDMSTWDGFAKWQRKLNEGRDELTPKVKSEIRALVAGVDDDKEKVRLIYNYLQENTRYVSIQLGIGGLQPFPAITVAENGYGDCKALSNYTYSLLKEAGIKSNYVKIRAGANEDDIITDFASAQFNHVILAVPMEKDTIWLECTSQQAPFNFLGGFTSDRHALMVTEEGGVLVKTPEYTAEENAQLRKVIVEMDAEGNAKASVLTRYKGRQYDDNYFIAAKGKEDQRKYLLNTIDIPAFDLGDVIYQEEKSENPLLTEEYDLTLRKYASVTGKRLFFMPNLLNKGGWNPPKDENRESMILNRYNYNDIDSVVFKLPADYRLEFDMEPVELKSEFGEYRLDYHYDPDKNELTYVRYIKVYKGRFPSNTYGDFRNFWRKVARSDKSKLVLIGNT
jgi:transglutaminase-like putative cysteine protease